MVEAGRMSVEIYDLRGLNCPLPVLKTRKKLRDMALGDELWIETTDPLAVIDVPHFCSENNHELLKTEEGDGINRFLIRRGA